MIVAPGQIHKYHSQIVMALDCGRLLAQNGLTRQRAEERWLNYEGNALLNGSDGGF
jgi:hypothetical protein